jgi:high-affinity Fe2+/Pb2+ permease
LKGLVAAAIGGAANSVSVMIVDPTTFNLQEGLEKVLTVAAVSAVVSAAMYLRQSPLPEES